MHAHLRRIVGWVAIYAVALHVILLGLAPMGAFGADAVDPFSVICHSAPGGAAGNESPARPDLIPGHACEHCNLANAVAPPLAPDLALAGNMALARVLLVLRPVSAAKCGGIADQPNRARGPPSVG